MIQLFFCICFKRTLIFIKNAEVGKNIKWFFYLCTKLHEYQSFINYRLKSLNRTNFEHPLTFLMVTFSLNAFAVCFLVVLFQWKSVGSLERFWCWFLDYLRLIVLYWSFDVCWFVCSESSVATWWKCRCSCRFCFSWLHFWLLVLLFLLNRLLDNCFIDSARQKKNKAKSQIGYEWTT